MARKPFEPNEQGLTIGYLRAQLLVLGFIRYSHQNYGVTVHLHPLKTRAIVLFDADSKVAYEYQLKNFLNATRRS